jgi:hypothetical protein
MTRRVVAYGRYFAWQWLGKEKHPIIRPTGLNGNYMFHHSVSIPEARRILNGRLVGIVDEGVIFVRGSHTLFYPHHVDGH